MTYGTVNVDSVVNSDGTVTGGLYGFKNRIINGAMVIDQRNAGASVTPTSTDYQLDRWSLRINQASKITVQQNLNSVTPPSGFNNYYGATVASAYSPTGGDYSLIQQRVEGFNFADFDWGTANAKTATISFWVQSSVTGTYGVGFLAAGNGVYQATYTINAANTWEYKTITVPGATSGTWSSDNTVCLRLGFVLGVGPSNQASPNVWDYSSALLGPTGQTQWVSTSGATFYITGVQFEKGSTATSFDFRDYGRELALCQRYYQRISGFLCATGSAALTSCATSVMFKTEMRTSPTVGLTSTLTVTQANTNDYGQTSSNVSIAGGGARVSTLGVNAAFDNFPTLPSNCPLPSLVNSGVLTLSSEL